MDDRDVIIARQCETIELQKEQIRQLKKLLVPVFCAPIEWNLTPQEQVFLGMFLKHELVTRDMFNAHAITRQNTKITEKHCEIVLCRLRKKLKTFGIKFKNEWGLGWRLVDRKSWRERLAGSEKDGGI